MFDFPHTFGASGPNVQGTDVLNAKINLFLTLFHRFPTFHWVWDVSYRLHEEQTKSKTPKSITSLMGRTGPAFSRAVSVHDVCTMGVIQHVLTVHIDPLDRKGQRKVETLHWFSDTGVTAVAQRTRPSPMAGRAETMVSTRLANPIGVPPCLLAVSLWWVYPLK